MLEHEPQETPAPQTFTAQIPAAERRVSAEELTRAVSALEDAKAAERIAGVAPIGQVVDELGLDSTPEEIWAQVQKQRAEAAAPKPQVHSAPVVQTQQIGRQVRRGWRHSKGWLWVIFWCTGGFGLLAGLPHMLHLSPSPGVDISGDRVTGSYNVQGTGPQRDVSVSGDHDKITLHGNVRNLSVDGRGNTVTVLGFVEAVTVDDDNNTIHWTKELPGKAVQPEVSGDGNIVGQSSP